MLAVHACSCISHPLSNADMIQMQVLIGADFYWDLVGDHVIWGNGPTAVNSKLGYPLSGPIPHHVSPPDSTVLFIATNSKRDVETNVHSYWDLETIGNYVDNYRDKFLTFEEGRYTAKLPWKSNHRPSRHRLLMTWSP